MQKDLIVYLLISRIIVSTPVKNILPGSANYLDHALARLLKNLPAYRAKEAKNKLGWDPDVASTKVYI